MTSFRFVSLILNLVFPPCSPQTVEGQTEENGLQISSAFSLNPDTPPGRPTASFNPGRGSGPMGQLVQNGDTGTHTRAGEDSHDTACVTSLVKCD